MHIIEVFKSDTEEERRKAVTETLVQYEEDKRNAAEPYTPLKTG